MDDTFVLVLSPPQLEAIKQALNIAEKRITAKYNHFQRPSNTGVVREDLQAIRKRKIETIQQLKKRLQQ